MKSIIKSEEVNQESKYPCLKIAQEAGDYAKVVLFTTGGVGTCVMAIGSKATLGEYSDMWDDSLFTHFKGTIELSN